mgnify:CR=1 FL=1
MTTPVTTAARTNPRVLLALASTAVALAAADTYVVVLALTDMMSGVGLGLDNLQRAAPIISGFLLGYIAVLPLIGRLADLVSRSRILLGCLVVFVVGGFVFFFVFLFGLIKSQKSFADFCLQISILRQKWLKGGADRRYLMFTHVIKLRW